METKSSTDGHEDQLSNSKDPPNNVSSYKVDNIVSFN